MRIINNIKAIPFVQKYRYAIILLSSVSFLGPLAFLPQLVGNNDLCGVLCMRRFYLYFPGMTFQDFFTHLNVAFIGVIAFAVILLTTFFYGRIWCSFLCPVGGLAELGSRMLNDRWKIEFRSLPQVQIRYGYFGFFLVAMPALGISACTLCNFITIPRLVEALSGEYRGMVYLVSSVGLVNLGLLLLLGFFASKGRAYCQFMCPIGAADGLVNRLGSKLKFTRRIRIEKERCTGCNVCARDCMCGAITMVDRIAVIDQLSCMSCHECVDVCDWNALAWTTVPDSEKPKRVKKGVEIHPQPDWQVINFMPKKEDAAKAAVFRTHSWARMINALILLSVLSVVIVGSFVL
ncbi:MAG: 4Fe-4S binding protein [Methylococcales bacterium]|nr:4Fe-4S binding protein [Methylococcales bacterium]